MEKENMNMRKNDHPSESRREFLRSATALGAFTLLPDSIKGLEKMNTYVVMNNMRSNKSIIGSYGPWADSLMEKPARLSFRNNKWKGLDTWRKEALDKAKEIVSSPEIPGNPKVTVNKKYQFDGLEIEELSWQLPYGQSTEAVLLKPIGSRGKLPAILGLHDHGGNKYFGKRKITRTGEDMHRMMIEHQKDYYGGYAWANEIAKRGYVVLVHDAFAFGSRRVLFENMTEIPWGHCATKGMSDDNPEEIKNIIAYNTWAGEHEHIMAKSLFCAGTTWPGVFLSEDQCALDVLIAREDVYADRIGCAGLSGGGLRTVYLGGLDHRIKCAVCVGFMTTWSDFLLNRSYTHTWMTYSPLMPKYVDFPEILGFRVPLPTMTLNNNQDGLYTLPEMKKADKILQEIFHKAGAAENYVGGFYEGDHKFDIQMQQDAFNWFDKWLK
jgi:dienelactone hydrolase